MNYRSEVAAIKRLSKEIDQGEAAVEAAKWERAQRTTALVEEGYSRKEIAADLGVGATAVSTWVRIWEAYGRTRASSRPRYTDADYEIAGRDSGFGRGAGVTSVPERHGDKVEVARKLLKDPEVAKSVARYAASTPVVRQAVHERERIEAERLVEPRKQHQEAQRGSDLDFSRIIVSMINVHHTLNRNLDLLRYHDLNREQRDEILEMAERIETSLGWMVSFAKSGSRSFDDELDALLGGGA